jgi:hypothetical protein
MTWKVIEVLRYINQIYNLQPATMRREIQVPVSSILVVSNPALRHVRGTLLAAATILRSELRVHRQTRVRATDPLSPI